MDGFKNIAKIPFFLLLIFLNASFFLQPDGEETIGQTRTKLQIDGRLADWDTIPELPIQFSPDGKTLEPSDDLAVTARFTFDSSHFFCSVRALDDRFEFPSRSWRYGDGLILTFVEPLSRGESDRFYSFGFSLEDKRTVKILVNRDGTYFPDFPAEDIQCVIRPDEKKREIIYEVAIPFKDLVPFKPFLRSRWALNLIYVDADSGKRQVLQLFPDPNYDTELVNVRKGRIFNFQSRLPASPEFQSSLNGSFFYHDAPKKIICAVNSPSAAADWKFRYVISSAFVNVSSILEMDLHPGMNILDFPIEDNLNESGTYDISIGIVDNNNSLRYREDHQFFIFRTDDLIRWSKKIAEAKESENAAESRVYRESLPSLEIRLEWISAFMKEAAPFSDIGPLKQCSEELDDLVQRIEDGSPALFPAGQISRLAHRSNIDDTLQPYSLYVPFYYDGKSPLPLFVSLHGSGVDEMQTIRSVSQQLAMRGNFIVLAPKARGLSDWYVGSSGEDVLECIDHVQKLYKVDLNTVVLDGFSMGGYGAWRLSCLYPERFRAVIIRSGAVVPPLPIKGENILDLLNEKTGLAYFIVHGDKDNSVSVDNARQATARLAELGIRFEYLELEGAAHGGYDCWKDIVDWMRRVLTD
jgi:predicted esterase